MKKVDIHHTPAYPMKNAEQRFANTTMMGYL
jgi:hypothetical protein